MNFLKSSSSSSSQMSKGNINRDDLYDDIMSLNNRYRPQHPTVPGTQLSTPYSIYMVPRTLRHLKPQAYDPRVISIGLIHASDPDVEPMNVHKESYMFSLFRRTVNSQETFLGDVVSRCVQDMESEAHRAGECYPQSVEFEVNTIARTMLVDGCFLLELLMRSSRIKQNWIRPYDPIFGDNLKFRDVVHDLLLLENQIPFFILEHLFGHTVERIQNGPNGSLRQMILEFFGNIMNSKFELKIEDGENEKAPDHILGLLHSCYRHGLSGPGDYNIRKYSATELHISGVKFKPSKRDDHTYLLVDFQTSCLFSWWPAITRTIFKTLSCSSTVPEADTMETPVSVSVSEPNPVGKHKCCLFSRLCQLCRRPTLEIPQLCITESTEPFLRNLIAFEQCSQNTPRYITSYAFLMGTIINSKEHVELLERGEILKNYLGTGEGTSDLFNNLCEEVSLGEFYFSKQWEQVDHYCMLSWPSLKRNYFSSPWSGISFFAASMLFAFTGIQTICSLISLIVGLGN